MKQEQVKQKVRQAVEHAAPDYSDRLREAADQLSAAPAGPRRSRRPRRLIAAVAAVAACAVLAVGALGIVRSQASQQGTAVVVLDVNPSILLSINSEERVLSVVAQNSDASRILDGMDLTGVQLNVAVNALIGSLLKNGYISELANSILISVEGADAQEAAQLQQRLTTEINELLAGFGIDGAILSQTLGQDDEVTALANSYEISRGKASLILELMGPEPDPPGGGSGGADDQRAQPAAGRPAGRVAERDADAHRYRERGRLYRRGRRDHGGAQPCGRRRGEGRAVVGGNGRRSRADGVRSGIRGGQPGV